MKTDIYKPTLALNLRLLSFIAALACIMFIAGSCDDDDDDSPNVTFNATLNGSSETPPNASTGTGTAVLTFNKDTKIFTVTVTYTGVTATAAHIHKADVGVAGDIIFGFTDPVTSPINYTSPALTAAQEADLMANLYYVNVHSSTYPGGEIRGQLIKK